MSRSVLALFLVALFVPALAQAEGKSPRMEDACTQEKSLASLNRKGAVEKNAALYAKIFNAQLEGEFNNATKIAKNLTDCRLMGHVLMQRYLHADSKKVAFSDLKNWMDEYADLPAASRIHKLAEARRPKGNKQKLATPLYKTFVFGTLEPSLNEPAKPYVPKGSRTDAQEADVDALKRAVRAQISDGDSADALEALNTRSGAKYMSDLEKAAIRANIAQSYLLEGSPKTAYSMASAIADRYGDKVPLAGWVAGLTSWMNGNYTQAAAYWETAAGSDFANGWMASGCSYWASRARFRAGDDVAAEKNLKLAAAYPRTFYGMLAIEALGQKFSYNWIIPEFTDEMRDAMLETPAGARALILSKAGQFALADAELAGLDPATLGETQKEALVAFALDAGMPAFALRYGNAFLNDEDRFYDAALYPMLPWDPAGGYTMDKALLHALVRQESRFRVRDTSHAGATGLMQLMPDSAADYSGEEALRDKERWRLKDPATNLRIGQILVHELFDMQMVDNNLFYMLAAYNAGPGSLKRWKRHLRDVDDPLLFIELVPVSETRAYIERVMRNTWIYQKRFGEETDSLTDLIDGQWPRYREEAAKR
ncbi:MAG: lytic transglycosylase domain-containing protein [Pseudobdellovibrionaceae bacterium]